MKARLLNLEAANAAIKPFLNQYLQEHGIDTTKNFKCLNPKHEDSTPSMTTKQDPERAYCFGCGQVLDIFTAANFLEGKPLKGKGFIDENVLYLAKKYNVDIEMADLTQEEVYEYRTYSAYKLAADLVADPKFGDYSKVLPEVEARGWTLERCIEYGIGTVDFQQFREVLKQAGYEAGFLDGIDLDRSNLFSNHNLIFTVYDDNGRPVGFSARNLKYQQGDPKAGPKYNNTRVTGLECNIFKKGERLYGFDIAKDAGSPLYIFEGQADVISARHHGYMNCVCTLGTAFTDHHINLLKQYGCFNLVFVFDADEGGEIAIQRVLDEKFSANKEFRVKLIQLPDGMDPDQLFREKGAAEFSRLKRWDAFEWRLNQFEEGALPEDIASLMIPIILSDPNHLRHEKMAKTLAKHTGFEFTTIMSEIKRRRDEKEADLAQRKIGIIDNALFRIRQNPDEADLLLTEARASIEDVQKKFGQDHMTAASVLDFILSQKEADEKKSNEFAGFFMRPEGMGGIAKRLDDDWKSDTWVCIGGVEQAGKTTFAAQMAYEIASDPRNNATIIYHSIDDAARFILFKMVANAANDLRLTLGHISNPNYWVHQEGVDPKILLKLREQGYQKIVQMVKDQQLILKDATDSASLAYEENLLRYYRETLPDRKIVLIIDNFHKLPDYAEIQGHERVKRISNHVKNMTTAYHATIISTVEYTKIYDNAKPSNKNIADSRSIAYDASALIHLHNDIHTRENGAQDAILVHQFGDALLPRIWCKFGKNKISGFEGREFLDLFPKWGTFRAVDTETAVRDQKQRLQFLRENKDNKIV
jgi:DNA primase catalytic core